MTVEAVREDAPHGPAPGRDGVALLAFSTRSSHGARLNWELLEWGRSLRRAGIRSVIVQLHYSQDDEADNARLTDELVRRVVDGHFAWAACAELWTADIGRRLAAAGVRVLEMRSPSFPSSVDQAGLPLPRIDGIGQRDAADAPSSATPLDEYAGLVELLGLPESDSVENVDLNIASQGCSYRAVISDNPFFADLATDPRFASHHGCSYCFNAEKPQSRPREPGFDEIDELLVEVRSRRAMLPRLKTLWLPFAEVFYDLLSEAFDRSVGDPVWRGVSLAMQCRPDVIVTRKADIETVAAKAHRAGTVLRIAVVGFENFSPAELARLNRGVTPELLVEAAAIVNAWDAHAPPGLDVHDYVPSFILFTPWTSLDDLELNLRAIEDNRLLGANIERMRLGPATPLHEMARRAGLTRTGPVRLAVHPNGYFSETAYGFKDPRVAAACDGFDALKASALADQAPLLRRVVEAVRRTPEPAAIDWDRIGRTWKEIGLRAASSRGGRERGRPAQRLDVERAVAVLARNGLAPRPELRAPMARLANARGEERARDDGPERSQSFAVTRACNNGCSPCVWSRRLEFRPVAALPLVSSVEGQRVHLGGREPTMRDDLPHLVKALRDGGARRIDLETNGRRLVYPNYVRALAAAGVDVLRVKLFGADAATWDAHTRAPGSFAQTVEGLAFAARFAPSIRLTAVIVPRDEQGARMKELVALATQLGFDHVSVQLRLAQHDLLGLDALLESVSAITTLASESPREGPRVSISVE